MDRGRLKRCLEQVQAYLASGLKVKICAQANGVSLLAFQIWCVHAGRWWSRLEGVEALPPARLSGFVAARLAQAAPRPSEAPSVRLDIGAGAGHVELHWPLAQSRELAIWPGEFTR